MQGRRKHIFIAQNPFLCDRDILVFLIMLSRFTNAWDRGSHIVHSLNGLYPTDIHFLVFCSHIGICKVIMQVICYLDIIVPDSSSSFSIF